MNQHQFTAARADQHRADLMAAAQHARDHRRARLTRTRNPKPRTWRLPRPLSLAFARQPAQLREAL